MNKVGVLWLIAIFFFGNYSLADVGIVDTVGWTSYDFSPIRTIRTIVNDIRFGTHIVWRSGYFPSYYIHYNFFDRDDGRWENGIGVFPFRAGFPSLHIMPAGGAVVGADEPFSSSFRLVVAKEVQPGSGLFYISEGPQEFIWPLIGVTQNGWIHFAIVNHSPPGGDRNIYYTRIREWGDWDPPVLLVERIGPYHNIASSINSNNLVVLWTTLRRLRQVIDSVGYRISTDGGNTWGPITYLPFPPAFSPGSESLPSFRAIYGFFDRAENLHIVASLYPVVRDTMRLTPAEIWHYCPVNNPAWSRIRRAEPETLAGEIDDIFATRPSIGQNRATGTLVATWEEFIGSNREPRTNKLRSGVWVAGSNDNGRTWTHPQVITDTTSTISFTIPCIAEAVDEYAWITYLADSVAGSGLPETRNLVLVHRVPLDWVGIQEGKLGEVPLSNSDALLISPNPFSSKTVISIPLAAISCPQSSIAIYDVYGKLVRSFSIPAVSGVRKRKVEFLWKGEDEAGGPVPTGIYILRLKGEGIREQAKLIYLR